MMLKFKLLNPYISRNNLILLRCFSEQATYQRELHYPKLSYYHKIGRDKLSYSSVGQELAYAVAKYGNNEAIVSVHEHKRHSFITLLDEVDRLAAGLHKLGLKRGDHIGIWGPNSISWYLTMLSAARAGLISVGINPAYQAPEIEYCLKKVNIKAIVAPEKYKTQNYYEILKSICPELEHSDDARIQSANLPNLKTVIIDSTTNGGKRKGTHSFSDVLGLCSTDEARQIAKIQNIVIPDTACNVQFTSGTTGKPKAAVVTHNNIVNNGIHTGNRNQLENQRICVQVPLFHAFGVTATIMAGLSKGATLVLPSAGFDPEASLRAIVEERCTVIHGSPTMYVDLIKKQRELKLPIKTAKMAVTGSASCSPQLFSDIKNVLGLQEVRSIYGLTETTCVAFQSCPGDSVDKILNTVGHIQDHIEAKVVDEHGNMVPFGEPGELYVRGYLTMLEYHEDELKTKETIGNDRWLKTGDQFVLEENGYGRIVGRLKEMIIRGGENIFPKEVEDFLNTHPDIIETHVVGVPDERMGEELCAFVRLHDGVNGITQQTLKEFCKGKLAHFKVPRYVIQTKDFPKTASGKIQKFKLQQLFMKSKV